MTTLHGVRALALRPPDVPAVTCHVMTLNTVALWQPPLCWRRPGGVRRSRTSLYHGASSMVEGVRETCSPSEFRSRHGACGMMMQLHLTPQQQPT